MRCNHLAVLLSSDPGLGLGLAKIVLLRPTPMQLGLHASIFVPTPSLALLLVIQRHRRFHGQLLPQQQQQLLLLLLGRMAS